MEFITTPVEIEKKSFEIITELLEGKEHLGVNAPIIKRVIHATADFEYLDNLVFSENVFERSIDTLRCGCRVITDTQMAKSGINKRSLEKLGGSAHCFVDAVDVMKSAEEKGVARSAVAMEYAIQQLNGPYIFAIGNAPTALIQLYDLIQNGLCQPRLIIGVPVGFVNVVESKELIMKLDVPFIVSQGRKGGSSVAAAICNALIYEALARWKDVTS